MREFKIKKNDLLLLFLVFFSIKITCISYVSDFLNILWYINTVIAILISIFYLSNKNRITKFDYGIVLFYLILFVSTLKNEVSLYNYIKDFIYFFSLYLTLRVGIEMNFKYYIRYSTFFLNLYTIINTLTTIIYYPDAMFRDNLNPIFFLGGDNTSVKLYVLCIGFNVLNNYFKYEKIKFPFISLMNLLIFSMVRDLGGGKVCFLIMLVTIIYFLYIKKENNRILRNIVIINIVLFFLLVIFNNIEIFKFFIVNVLHRNLSLTDRTIIWDITINEIVKKPILGHGFINGLEFQSLLPHIIGVNAHNTYLMIIFVGGSLLMTSFLWIVYMAIKEFDNNLHCSKVIYIIPICLFTLLIRGQIEGWDVSLIFLLLAMCNYYKIIEDAIKNNSISRKEKDEEYSFKIYKF